MPARSRRLLIRAVIAAVLGLTAAFTAACGTTRTGKGLLSRAQSRTIVSALNAISSAVSDHSCARAQTAVNSLDNALRNLGPDTSSSLVTNLGHGATTVSQLALTQCRPTKKTTTSTTSSTTTNSSTAVTSTTVTPTSTTATAPTTTQSVPATTTTPATTPATTTPGNGNGNGNGNGKGGGGGAGLGGGGSQ